MAETQTLSKKPAAELNGPESTRGGVYYSPRVDICETSDELILACDMPGVRPEDLDVQFDNGQLKLHGKVTPRQESAVYDLNEYGVGDFYRSFTIDGKVEAAKIAAEYKHGVLTVHLPKKEEVKARRIAVKAD